jgi:hypothetical protein
MSYFTVVILIYYSDFLLHNGFNVLSYSPLPLHRSAIKCPSFWFLKNGIPFHISVTKLLRQAAEVIKERNGKVIMNAKAFGRN